jgi:acyl-CoA thioester hydrolase
VTPVLQAVAHPWQCDVLEHLTTRYYVAIFDDASYHYLFRLFGWNGNKDAEGRLAWVDVKHTVSYLAEVSAGDLLEVSARLTKIGGKSITINYEMKRLADGEVVAKLESISVLFDLTQRAAARIPDNLRKLAESQL